MAVVTVTHTKSVVVPDDPSYPVGSTEWNAGHNVAGLENVQNVDTTNPANITYTRSGVLTVPRSVASKLQESASVLDFGAKGDGITDDTVAIQAALNSTAGIVYFPGNSNSRTYIVTSQLTVPANVSIRGDGPLATIVVGNFSGPILNRVGNSSYSSFVKDISIRENNLFLGYGATTAIGFQPGGMAINPDMDIAQLNGATAVTGITAGAVPYVLDGWQVSAQGATVTAQQVSDAPPGYTSSLKISVTTADPSPAAGDYVDAWQAIEANRMARCAFGTANASPLSVAFWAKANRPGNYSACLQNAASTRFYAWLFNIAASGVWQRIATTIPGDTGGTWLTGGAANGMFVDFNMMMGSTGSGAPNAWTNGGASGATGGINGAAATSDYLQITGVLVVPGTELPPADRQSFVMRSADTELLLCQRRLWFWNPGASAAMAGLFMGVSTTAARGVIPVPTNMRASPALTLSNMQLNAVAVTGGSVVAMAENLVHISATAASGLAANTLYWLNSTTTAGSIKLDSQL